MHRPHPDDELLRKENAALKAALHRVQQHADAQQRRAEAAEDALRRSYSYQLNRRTRED